MSLPACCDLPPDNAPIEHAGYAAYNAGGDPATAGLNYAGKPCPNFDDLPPNVKAKWKAARQEMARRILDLARSFCLRMEDDIGRGQLQELLAELTED